VSLGLPVGVQQFDDIVARRVEMHMLVHRPGRDVTPCGERMDVMQPPIGAYRGEGLAARWCPECFPQESAWQQIVDAAHPANPRAQTDIQARDRGRFPVNSSRRWSIAAFLHLNGRRA
jgi:hypothetical protein